MPSTPSVELSQASVFSLTGGETASVEISQAFVTSIVNYPTAAIELSQSFVSLLTAGATPIVELSQTLIMAVVCGRADDPTIRVWTFTLDGHDFYVLRLGNSETLLYDVLSQQWSVWSTAEELYWSVYTGANWVGGNNFATVYGSNVVVGSDSNGSLFFLDPDKVDDDANTEDRPEGYPFVRQVTGQLESRQYNSTSVHEVHVLGSLNQLEATTDNTVELLYSDTRGDSYVSAGILTTTPDDYDFRGHWQSLGSFTAPGRLFRIQDFGALTRIDSLTVILGTNEKK